MGSHQKRPVTLQEHLINVILVSLAVLQTLLAIPTTLRAVQNAGWPWKRVIAVSLLRNRTALVKQPARLANVPTTGESIAAACHKRNIPVSSRSLQCGHYPDAALHEIKLRDDEGDTLLYFHGGGYRNVLNGEGHVPIVLDCAAAARASKVVFLEYTLTPELKYPGQLAQAARALDLLLNDKQGIRPSQLIIGGDSAGGNLTLALLAHLKQPHPATAIPPVVGFKASDQFKAIFLLSPWVTIPCTARSFAENASRDYLSAQLAETFLDLWRPREGDIWADPLRAGADFWKKNALPASRVFISAGAFEAFRDDVVSMAGVFEAVLGERLTFVLAPGEVHVQAAVDKALGLSPAKSLVALLEWLQAL